MAESEREDLVSWSPVYSVDDISAGYVLYLESSVAVGEDEELDSDQLDGVRQDECELRRAKLWLVAMRLKDEEAIRAWKAAWARVRAAEELHKGGVEEVWR